MVSGVVERQGPAPVAWYTPAYWNGSGLRSLISKLYVALSLVIRLHLDASVSQPSKRVHRKEDIARVPPSKRQQVLPKLLMLIGLAHQSPVLEGGDEAVFDFGQGAAVDVGHGEEEAVAADLLHRLAHLGRDGIRRAAEVDREVDGVVAGHRLAD